MDGPVVFVGPPGASRVCPVLLDGALGSSRQVHQTYLDLPKRPEPVDRASGGSVVGERHAFVIAQGGQCLDHAVVPVPAGWDHPDLDGEAVDELLDPLPQIGKRLG